MVSALGAINNLVLFFNQIFYGLILTMRYWP